jgi:hypothetical protein
MGNETGRMSDVLVTERYKGIGFTVWADPGKEDLIYSVEGVVEVWNRHKTEYRVHYDLRYDMDTIIWNVLEKLNNWTT